LRSRVLHPYARAALTRCKSSRPKRVQTREATHETEQPKHRMGQLVSRWRCGRDARIALCVVPRTKLLMPLNSSRGAA
jgi:hypothetical protein